jgi:hypothetical protein
VLLLHSIGDDLGETVPGNRNTMPGDGSRKLTMGLLDCWLANQPCSKTPFLSRGIFHGSAAEIFHGVPELIIVPLAGGYVM